MFILLNELELLIFKRRKNKIKGGITPNPIVNLQTALKCLGVKSITTPMEQKQQQQIQNQYNHW